MESIIRKYLSGRSSLSEQKGLLQWLRKDDHPLVFREVKEEWEEGVSNEDIPLEYRQIWSEVQNTIQQSLQSELFKVRRNLNFFRYAAIFIMLISIPSLIYLMQAEKSPASQLVYTTVTAENGQISKVVLPDSSMVWINSGSSVSYNNHFSVNNRDINLLGEAYFKIHKNIDLPLLVTNSGLQVKVLGTEFSVSAYAEDPNIQVVLEKGKVELSQLDNTSARQEMKPGELASFSKEKKELTLTKVNTRIYTSWKDGLINIYNLPLNELVIKLEKRFNQKFVVDESIKNMPFTFTIKNEDLNSVLSLMEKITPIDVIQRGNVIELKTNKNRKLSK
jgi:ferric-dicitrate binding protein FerR (iron transport regulator)